MKIILVGGFLGSGKTTAIIGACKLLMQQNRKVAVICNDQGDQQVDSAFLKSFGIHALEVANGCFCCKYEALDKHIEALQKHTSPDIIFAESVGSCTDLIATIAKPLGKFKPDTKTVISIFADAGLLLSLIEGNSSFIEESVHYIFKKQLEEADLLVLNKIDLLTSQQISTIQKVVASEYPGKIILNQNSLNENDTSKWLTAIDEFTEHHRSSLELNYDTYGDGESKLAWLDKSIVIDAPLGNGAIAARYIMQNIFDELQLSRFIIGHVKFFLETNHWKEKFSYTTIGANDSLKIRNEEVTRVGMLINARVLTEPTELEQLVDHVLNTSAEAYHCKLTSQKEAVFKPGFPKPTHRMV